MPLNSLHQEVADNFYPERADFTVKRWLGQDFASNLMTSYPVLCRRKLGNQFTTMLRPTAKPWFHTARRHEKTEDNETRQWLQHFEETQRRAMYDPAALFTRATKEGDHDYAAFGQCALSVEHNLKMNTLLYRCWHLKDMAWQENEDGKIGFKVRLWKPTAQVMNRVFKDKVDQKVVDAAAKEPFTEFECMHMMVESDMYDDNAMGRPWFSIWWDVTHDKLLDAKPMWGSYYIIPRWQTVSGSQYSFSPATVAALPEARLIQAMTFTLLEAGEKATNPPLIAVQDAVRSDISVYAGGITWVDNEYDEKTGEALRPIAQDLRGFNHGVQMNGDSRLMIREAFFLDTLQMPQRGPEMTAYEVGQRIQQYIRDALPLFEPMEMDYNAALCEETFNLMWRAGAFGPPSSWPKSLRNGADIEFKFESPLHDAIEEQKSTIFIKGNQLIAQAAALDPSVSALPNAIVGLRDALAGIGYEADWMHSEADVDEAIQAKAAAAQQQQLLANLEQGSKAAANLGGALASNANAAAAPA